MEENKEITYIHKPHGKVIIMDTEDYIRINKNIHVCGNCTGKTKKKYANKSYAQFIDGGKKINLHRYLMGVTDKKLTVDHINGNGLDNRKSNLRICTRSQNVMNKRKTSLKTSSKWKGVSYDKRTNQNLKNRWKASIEIKIDGIRKSKKMTGFSCEEDAAMAYNYMASNLFGEYAYLNESTYNKDDAPCPA